MCCDAVCEPGAAGPSKKRGHQQAFGQVQCDVSLQAMWDHVQCSLQLTLACYLIQVLATQSLKFQPTMSQSGSASGATLMSIGRACLLFYNFMRTHILVDAPMLTWLW